MQYPLTYFSHRWAKSSVCTDWHEIWWFSHEWMRVCLCDATKNVNRNRNNKVMMANVLPIEYEYVSLRLWTRGGFSYHLEDVCGVSLSYPHHYLLEHCGTVPNPEKSRLSCPAGQTGLSRKFFGTGQTGRDNIEKTCVPNFFIHT